MKFGKGVKVNKVTKGNSMMQWVDEKKKEEQKGEDNIFEKDL